MLNTKVTIKNATGLHMRPAGVLCDHAALYKSKIIINYKGGTANAKSVISVLGACIKFGDEVEFIFEGADEEAAESDIIRLIENGLGD